MNAEIRLPPRAPSQGFRAGRPARPPRRRGRVMPLKRDFGDWMLLLLLLLTSIQSIQIAGAQLGQMLAILILPVLLVQRRIAVSGIEVWTWALLLGFSLCLTVWSGYPHTKAPDQILKFAVVYPAFYLIGRYYGARHQSRPLPYGYLMLWGFLGFQFLIQQFKVPLLYKEINFAVGALHGSFKERNWIAAFFFLASYVYFLRTEKTFRDVAKFMALAVVVTLLTQSKTVLIPCAMVLLVQVRGYVPQKILMIAAGAALYVFQFSRELTGDELQVRLKEERGLALSQSIKLVQHDWVGHGFGFVEHYFANSAVTVAGLGSGTNAVFCSPLDLVLIAGPVGLLAWLVFFCGIGFGWRAMLLLAPVAAWSMINPMHQSETVYLFAGWLVTHALSMRMAGVSQRGNRSRGHSSILGRAA